MDSGLALGAVAHLRAVALRQPFLLGERFEPLEGRASDHCVPPEQRAEFVEAWRGWAI